MASAPFEVGDLVKFKTVAFGWVNARVILKKRYVPLLGERIRVRVTSRTNKGYPMGLCYEFTPGSLVLRPRPKKES